MYCFSGCYYFFTISLGERNGFIDSFLTQIDLQINSEDFFKKYF